jgi:hypothetical protein
VNQLLRCVPRPPGSSSREPDLQLAVDLGEVGLDGELTPTLKLKRKPIAEKHAAEIALYAPAPPPASVAGGAA